MGRKFFNSSESRKSAVFEFAALRALVRDAVVGGGIGVQSHGVRVDVQDVVGRDAGAVLQGFYAGFAGRRKGMGSTLLPAGAQMREVRVFSRPGM